MQAETAVISARTAQTRDVRDELVGAKNDLSATRQQKLQDISHLNAQEQGEASEIDALQEVPRSADKFTTVDPAPYA